MRYPRLQPLLLWQVDLLYWLAGLLGVVWFLPAICCALLPILVDKRLHKPARLLVAGILWLAGFAVASFLFANPNPDEAKQLTRFCADIEDVQTISTRKTRLVLSNVHAENEANKKLSGLVVWTWEEPLFHPLTGQKICLSRTPNPIHSFANFGLADHEITWKAQGVFWRVWSKADKGQPTLSGEPTRSASLRKELYARFLQVLAGTQDIPLELTQAEAILPAVLFGDRQYLDLKTRDLFAQGTLAHSLALSGQHLAVAGFLGMLCIFLLGKIYPRIYLWSPRVILILFLSCPLALLYLWLGNAPASLIRATCMLFILTLQMARRKTFTTLDLLATTVLLISVLSPLQIFNTGLQLSVLSVAVIGILLPTLRRILSTWPKGKDSGSKRFMRYFVGILLISFSINLAILPLNILLFGNAGVWFILNIIWLPLLNVLVLPGAVAGLLLTIVGWNYFATLALHLATLPCQGIVSLLSTMEQCGAFSLPLLPRPHWTALLAFACLVPGFLQRSKKLISVGVVFLCIEPCLYLQEMFSDTACCDILDVGQGQAVFLRLPGHQHLLVDGGGLANSTFDTGSSLVAPALLYNNLPTPLTVLNSHADFDHAGGLIYILSKFKIAEILHNGREAKGQLQFAWQKALDQHKNRILTEHDILDLGSETQDFKLEVLHPPKEKKEQWKGNDSSLILRLTWRGHGLVLLPGDAGIKSFKRILQRGYDVSADVLIAPHHGSDKNFLRAFCDAVNPKIVVVSCGFQNRYKFPGRKLTQWLAEKNIPLFSTAQDGGIKIIWTDKNKFQINTAR